MRVLVRERRTRVPDDLAVPVIFHHDDEYMVQSGNAFGNGALLSQQYRAESGEHTKGQ